MKLEVGLTGTWKEQDQEMQSGPPPTAPPPIKAFHSMGCPGPVRDHEPLVAWPKCAIYTANATSTLTPS